MNKPFVSIVLACYLLSPFHGRAEASNQLERLEEQIPHGPSDCRAERISAIRSSTEAIEEWAAGQIWSQEQPSPAQIVERIRALVAVKRGVDGCLERVLTLRVDFVGLPAGAERREMLRQYLRATAALIDLSGRMRYLLRDAIDAASYTLSPHPIQLEALIDMLLDYRVSIGAAVMSYTLFDPLPESGLNPFPIATKKKVLRLIEQTEQVELLPVLADLVRRETTSSELVIEAAEIIRRIGLPQDPLPEQKLAPPAIVANQLREIVSRIDSAALSSDLQRRRAALIHWLDLRSARGITSDTFPWGSFELRSGDWLLMRNPSPYNSFTDLAPGLFTHVGVVSVVTDEQGIRRFVIVDLPERGDRVPAATVDAYLQRTLHYTFLRHRDAHVQQRMGQAAASMVGNETQFDLTFRTDRVLALKGKPLSGQRINTYCAGFLLLCAQQTEAPRHQFFPIPEYPAGGHCLENLAKLGISIGDDFISPTGAIFSPYLEIIGRREPMYSPEREVKEGIYDYFAESMVKQELTPAPSTFQALRERIAGISQYNPLLAKALAHSSNVSEHMDLEAAAKAAAVIETLDEIADANRDSFIEARRAMIAGPLDRLTQNGLLPEELDRIQRYRKVHRDLFSQWTNGGLSPRQLRIALVRYYQLQGQRALDERFFQTVN